jgi:hypothetical protein
LPSIAAYRGDVRSGHLFSFGYFSLGKKSDSPRRAKYKFTKTTLLVMGNALVSAPISLSHNDRFQILCWVIGSYNTFAIMKTALWIRLLEQISLSLARQPNSILTAVVSLLAARHQTDAVYLKSVPNIYFIKWLKLIKKYHGNRFIV